MRRAARGVQGRNVPAERPEISRRARAGIAVLALAGIVVSGYLAVLHFTEAGLVCVVGSGCNVVQESAYATIVGVPVALAGLLGYGAILWAVVGWPRLRNQGLVLYVLVLAGFVFSSYLTFVELFVIRAVCPYCLFSYGLITGILVLLLVPRPVVRGLPLQGYRSLSVGIVAVVLVASLVLQWNAGASPAEDSGGFAATLAKHLTEEGIVMYGAYWCPHCADQKALFGDAFKYVQYVECDPKGKNANFPLCVAKGIEGFPTWEIRGRFYDGVQSLATLAQLSGLALTEP